jgi:hypothetical protein
MWSVTKFRPEKAYIYTGIDPFQIIMLFCPYLYTSHLLH